MYAIRLPTATSAEPAFERIDPQEGPMPFSAADNAVIARGRARGGRPVRIAPVTLANGLVLNFEVQFCRDGKMYQYNLANRNRQEVKELYAGHRTPAVETTAPTPTYEHRRPDGGWEVYSAEQAKQIHEAASAGMPVCVFAGTPFEVRFGAAATSAKVRIVPETGMLQVNTVTQNSRVVRRHNPSPPVLHPRPPAYAPDWTAARRVEQAVSAAEGKAAAEAKARAAEAAKRAAADSEVARLQLEIQKMKDEAGAAAKAVEQTAWERQAPHTIKCGEYQRALRFLQVSHPELWKFVNPDAHGMCFCDACDQFRGEPMCATFERGESMACKLCQENKKHLKHKHLKQCAKSCSMYAIPSGWQRFALRAGGEQAAAIGAFDRWHVAFHGTHFDSLVPILTSGQLAKPGDTVVVSADTVKTLGIRDGHIPKPFKRRNEHCPGVRETFDPNQIFFSPTIKYCECSAYTTPTQWNDPATDKAHSVKAIFQLRVLPGSYSVGPSTSGSFDVSPFDKSEVEWYSTGAIGSVIVTDVLIKMS